MPKNLTTIGVKISYAVETIKDTRPTSDYIHIPNIKSTNDFNPQPSTADGTTFDETEFTTKVPLLKEAPDNMEFTANLSQEFYDAWATLVSAYNTANESNKNVWFCIDIKGLDKSIYFTGVPSALGIPEMSANSIVEITAYVTPTGEPVFATDPTYKTV